MRRHRGTEPTEFFFYWHIEMAEVESEFFRANITNGWGSDLRLYRERTRDYIGKCVSDFCAIFS